MTNEEIYKLIGESGLKINYIACRLNINRTTLWRKLNNKGKFTELELKILYKILGVEYDNS